MTANTIDPAIAGMSTLDDSLFNPINRSELVGLLAKPPCWRRLIIPIGIQCSGKSTLSQALSKIGFTWICCDKIQAEVDKTLPSVVAIRAFELLIEALSRQEAIVIDGMCIREAAIDPIVKEARKLGEVEYAGYTKSGYIRKHACLPGYDDIVFVYFDISPLTCLKRNLKRENPIHPETIKNAFNEFSYRDAPYAYPYRIITLREDPSGVNDYLYHDLPADANRI